MGNSASHPLVSVVIPAHDEEAVIGRCLSGLLRDAAPGELEVVVVCNGCTDATAAVARGFGGVLVEDLPTAGKAAALDHGDAVARTLPRVFLDADVELTTDAVRRTAAVLARDGVLAAAPEIRFDLRGASWGVRGFYRIYARGAWATNGLLGSGLYGLSADGRARFDRFPPIIADDFFIRTLFTDAEREVVAGAHFTIRPPRTLRALVRTRTRIFAGNREFRARYPDVPVPRSDSGDLPRILRGRPSLLPAAIVYVAVQGLAKLQGRRRWATGTATWNRDATGRGSV